MLSTINRLRNTQSTPQWLANKLAKVPRLTIVCISVAFLLVPVWLVSAIILSLNPYRSAVTQVAQILVIHPDLESRLNYGQVATNIIKPGLNPEIARQIIVWHDNLNQQDLTHLAASLGGDPAAVYHFIQMMERLSREIVKLDSIIVEGQTTPSFASAISRIRSDHETSTVDDLLQIYTGIPPTLQKMNALRTQTHRIDPLVHQVLEDPLGPAALLHLQNQPQEMNEHTLLLGTGYRAWVNLPDRCVSLEIQFVNNIAVLNQIYTTIAAARHIDQLWGYSLWQPAAAWIQRESFNLGILIFLLGLTACIPFFWHSNFKAKVAASGKLILSRLRNWSQLNLNGPLPDLFGKKYFHHPSGQWVKNLVVLTRLNRVSPLQANGVGQVVVQYPDGSQKEIKLPTKGIFRIGSDPGFGITTYPDTQSYIEIWIHKAHRCYFMEVMFSDKPVILNHKPIKTTRALKQGDLIQVEDLRIIFLG